MLDHDTKALLRESFALLPADRAPAAQAFYARLFELAPETRGLFHIDIGTQGKKLFDMLDWIITHLEQPQTLLPSLRALGVRHAGYHVRIDHYAAIGSALLWMFQQQLGARFTPDMEEAWLTAYAFISAEMERGQREAE